MQKLTKIGEFFLTRLKLVVIAGLAGAALFAFYSVYKNYYGVEAIISLVYPGIEDGEYPNGERFMMYDIICADRINEALAAMKKKGWYTGLSAGEIRENLHIGVYLDKPVQNKVTRERQGGINYTYYSNEYYISFHQPFYFHITDFSGFFGLLDANLSGKFLNELLLANYQYLIANYQKNSAEFESLALAGGAEKTDYDYKDLADIYARNISSCLDYLYNIQNDGEKYFVSDSSGLSFENLIVSYETLLNIKVAEFSSYAKTRRLTNRLEQLQNRNLVAAERYYYKMLKKQKESEIARNAMDIYDHTFTKQIIIVGANSSDGLYQARPKTGYDTVTQRALQASVDASSYKEQIDALTRENAEYAAIYGGGTGYRLGIAALDEMADSISAQYDALLKKTLNTISDYSRVYNKNYIRTIDVGGSLFGAKDFIKAAAIFIAFAITAAFVSYLAEISKKAAKATRVFCKNGEKTGGVPEIGAFHSVTPHGGMPHSGGE